MTVYLRITKGINNSLHFSLFKYTGELFRYKYIEDGNSYNSEYNKCSATVQLFPEDRKSDFSCKWYEIKNYGGFGFITKLAKYVSDSNNPYENFIEEIESMIDRPCKKYRMDVIKL
jgi:hypothetical protein